MWTELFSISVAPLELVLRGTLVYWFVFLLFRFVLRRETGSIGLPDILLLVLIADAAQNAMASGYTSVSEGVVLIVTIAGWSWLMDWAAYHFPMLRPLIEPPSRVLVRHGRLVRRNLRRELITVPELMALLREQGVDRLVDVAYARLESDGEISVIRRHSPRAAGFAANRADR